METEDFRKIQDALRDPLRRQAMRMIKRGMKKKEVALILGVHANSITNWGKKYNLQGTKGLTGLKRGVKSEDKKLLSVSQEQQIQAMICDIMPDQLKLPYALWTRKAVKELIDREFGVSLAINTTGDYLRSWGFTPQKPNKKMQKYTGEMKQE